MNRKELLEFKDKYDKEEDLENKGTEEELRIKFQEEGFLTKADLLKIVAWKFQGKLLGRQKRISRLIETVDETFIEDVSRLAFRTPSDENKLKLLCCTKGVGNALGCSILAFYDPEKYGVLDIHAWRGLFQEKEPKDLFTKHEHAFRFFSRLREISSTTGLSCRDIEKAFFKKDLDGSKKRN